MPSQGLSEKKKEPDQKELRHIPVWGGERGCRDISSRLIIVPGWYVCLFLPRGQALGKYDSLLWQQWGLNAVWIQTALSSVWATPDKVSWAGLMAARGVSGSCSYPKDVTSMWTRHIKLWRKAERTSKVCGSVQTNLVPSLFTKLIQAKASPLQPKQKKSLHREHRESASVPVVFLYGSWSTQKQMDHYNKGESFLPYHRMLSNSHENLRNSPCCFPKCLCLSPRLSYPFNPVQKIQDQSWWDMVSLQLFSAPFLEFGQFSFLSRGIASSDTSVSALGFGTE